MYSLSGGYLGPWANPAAASKFASTRHAMSRIEILLIRVAVIVIAMDLSFLGLSARSSVPFPLPPGAVKGTDQFSISSQLHGPPCDRSRRHHAAVHRQDAAGRPAGLIRREIDRGLGNFFRLSQPTHRMHPFEPGLGLWVLQHTCDARGHDSGRADAVASDVLFRVVDRHRLGEHDDARLGRLVGMSLKAEDGLEPTDRGDIQDRAASLLQHLGNRCANESERALHEHVKGLIPNVIGGLVEPRRVEQVARVVDQDVEASEGPDGGRHRFPHVWFVGHAALERQGLSAFPLNVSDDALQLVLPPAGDRDLRAFSRKDLRNRFADAGPATGYNRYLVFESHGCVLLCCRVLLSVTRRAVKRKRRKPSGSALL